MLKFQKDKLRLGYAPTRRDMFRDPLVSREPQGNR